MVGINNPDHNPQGDFNVKDNIVKVNEYKNDQTWTGVSIINPTIFEIINSINQFSICGTQYYLITLKKESLQVRSRQILG